MNVLSDKTNDLAGKRSLWCPYSSINLIKDRNSSIKIKLLLYKIHLIRSMRNLNNDWINIINFRDINFFFNSLAIILISVPLLKDLK